LAPGEGYVRFFGCFLGVVPNGCRLLFKNPLPQMRFSRHQVASPLPPPPPLPCAPPLRGWWTFLPHYEISGCNLSMTFSLDQKKNSAELFPCCCTCSSPNGDVKGASLLDVKQLHPQVLYIIPVESRFPLSFLVSIRFAYVDLRSMNNESGPHLRALTTSYFSSPAPLTMLFAPGLSCLTHPGARMHVFEHFSPSPFRYVFCLDLYISFCLRSPTNDSCRRHSVVKLPPRMKPLPPLSGYTPIHHSIHHEGPSSEEAAN